MSLCVGTSDADERVLPAQDFDEAEPMASSSNQNDADMEEADGLTIDHGDSEEKDGDNNTVHSLSDSSHAVQQPMKI